MAEIFTVTNFDLKSFSSVTIFTPTSDFVITSVTCVGTDITGPAEGAELKMGTNAPNFDNYVTSHHNLVKETGDYQYFSIGGTVNPVVHPGSSFQAVVVVPDSTATTNVQRIDVSGYYL